MFELASLGILEQRQLLSCNISTFNLIRVIIGSQCKLMKRGVT